MPSPWAAWGCSRARACITRPRSEDRGTSRFQMLKRGVLDIRVSSFCPDVPIRAQIRAAALGADHSQGSAA